MARSLGGLKSQRTQLQKKVTESLEEARSIVKADITTADFDEFLSRIEVSLAVLERLRDKFESISQKILDCSEGRGEYEIDQDSELSVDVETEITRMIAQLSSKMSRITRGVSNNGTEPQNAELTLIQQKIDKLVELQSLQNASPDLSSSYLSESFSPRTGHNTRLPKLEFQKFSGNVLAFREFWDSFEAAVHSNPSLRAVEKLNYLRAYLVGEAKHVISGVSTCDANYEVAVQLLRKRYGDPQASIDAHYSKLTNLSPVQNQTSKLRSLMDEIEKHLRCLSALGEDIEHRHFISMIMSKLPREVVVRLEEGKDDTESWSVELLRTKLQSQLSARESAERQQPGESNGVSAKPWNGYQPRSYKSWSTSKSTVEGLVASERGIAREYTRKGCSLCTGDHFTDQCRKFKSIDERRRQLRDRCFICLSKNHRAKECPSTKPCAHCKQIRRHNRCLCPIKFPKVSETSAVSAEDSSTKCDDTSSSGCSNERVRSDHTVLASGDRVLLQTATVEVKSPEGSVSVSTRVLLDCASNRSYISTSLAQKLQLKPCQMESFSVVTFGSEKPKNVETSITRIELFQKDKSSRILDVNVVPKITGMIHRSPVQLPDTNFLWKDLPLADSFPVSSESSPVDFLIGNDYYLDIIGSEKIEVRKGLYLLGSKLGWILTGRIESSSRTDPEVAMFISSSVNRSVSGIRHFSVIDSSLPIKPSFEDFWRLESIGIHDSPDVSDDDQAIVQFNSSVQMVSGRYQVTWPRKDPFPDLPDNYQLALGRLRSLMRRFQADDKLFKKYADVIKDQEAKGVVEKVHTLTKEGPYKHYIPHHPVLSPGKATTKVRIVYDASAKVRKGTKSLNDCLLRGPVLLEDLCGLLIRFRLAVIGIVSDIEKAFLQIGLQEAERDVTRFFWLKDDTKPSVENNLQIYRFCRVPFGIVSSPFLLAATVRYHLSEVQSSIKQKLMQNIYVDNVVTGVDSEEEAAMFYSETKQIFSSASMNIREWASNSSKFMGELPATEKVQNATLKVLGMCWDTTSDDLYVKTGSNDSLILATTKREMFRALASVFDPLGFFVPLTVKAKLFIHQLWVAEKDWDEEIRLELLSKWKPIAEDLSRISNYRIPRFIGLPDQHISSMQLLCFCDASALAYSTAIYARITSDTEVKISLIFAKSRLAPTRSITIPRIELLATLIGVRSLIFVEKQLNICVSERILWTDSQCVLHWLNSKKPLTIFVENRIREIKKHSNVSFRYINGNANPADIATRGQFTYEEVVASCWWSGPTWLKQSKQHWPSWPYDVPASEVSSEGIGKEGKKEYSLVSNIIPYLSPFGIDVHQFSSLLRLYRITAWISRFLDKCRKKSIWTGSLDGSEVCAAKLMWDRHTQRTSFPDVFSAIRNGVKCNIKEQLNVMKDEEGILRCYGRFLNSDLPEQAKFPKLLPKNDHYTDLIIRYFHTRLLHSGSQHTLSQIRLEYWIPQGRAAVRRIISKCVVCRRLDVGPYRVPFFPPFPENRVSRYSPFSSIGLDYLGPLYVKDDSSGTRKVWVCLFTCMVVRAVHLELVENLSADQFLLSFRRFIARRGRPDQIISDNASQFKASKKVLHRLWGGVISDADVISYVSSKGISWKFIVERAPWMGASMNDSSGQSRGP